MRHLKELYAAFEERKNEQHDAKKGKVLIPPYPILKILNGLGHDWDQCLFTKIIWNEIIIEFLQRVIQM